MLTVRPGQLWTLWGSSGGHGTTQTFPSATVVSGNLRSSHSSRTADKVNKQSGTFTGDGAGLRSEADYPRSKEARDQHGPGNRPLSQEGIGLAFAQWIISP